VFTLALSLVAAVGAAAPGAPLVDDDAQVLQAATELPPPLSCGQVYRGFVTFLNTGTSTWSTDVASGQGAWLGAVDDQDPFGLPTRFAVASGTAPNLPHQHQPRRLGGASEPARRLTNFSFHLCH